MKIEILYFDGCPNHQPAIELVHQVLQEVGVRGSAGSVISLRRARCNLPRGKTPIISLRASMISTLDHLFGALSVDGKITKAPLAAAEEKMRS